MDGHYTIEMETALGAVAEAARLCQRVGSSIDARALEKPDRSPVTIADFGSQALICRALRQAFPRVPIIAEEDTRELAKPENQHLVTQLVHYVKELRPGTKAADILRWIEWGGAQHDPGTFWTLDPLDGTKGFLRGAQYAISLCLVVGGELTVAALACPRMAGAPGQGSVFGAARGLGAFQLPLDLAGDRQPIRVSDVGETRAMRFAESVEPSHSSHEYTTRIAEILGIATEPVRLDSQVKYGAVARGDTDAYVLLPLDARRRFKLPNIWDHAGGALVVAEAGGKVTDTQGNPLDFGQGRTLASNRGVIASNGRVHDAVLEAIAALGLGDLELAVT
ncbi:MAG: 3'(2'),5'-bisphosphate nucleotidase [Polyangiaceae bacterium]|nr:3'(2'),5'-bisphosphate nucleotidase [Polyangiaceae bacterium]